MPNKQLITRSPLQRQSATMEEEEAIRRPEEREADTANPTMVQDPMGLEFLQDQVGNLAVQQILAQGKNPAMMMGPEAMAQLQPPANEEEAAAMALAEPAKLKESEPSAEVEDETEAEKTAKEPIEVGEVTVEKPEIEYYDIKAANLKEAKAEVKKPEEWFEYKYEHDTKAEQDAVVEAKIKIKIIINLPRWVGPGWDKATPAEKAEWEKMLASFQLYDEKYKDMAELPGNILLGSAWEKAPDTMKTNWRSELQSVQKEEEGHLDRALRRAMVLQQRLLNQPEKEIKNIFDQFIKDLEAEEEEYQRRQELGKEAEVSLSGDKLLQ